MRLQAFIIDEGRTKTLSSDTALDLIENKCSKHVKGLQDMKRPRIYRGIKTFNDEYGIVDPRQGRERLSANTSNHMTLLMDNLPSWKGYPKRSQSIICSTSIQTAQHYGWNGVYHIYPTNGCNMGIVPTRDIWQSFGDQIDGDIPQFNSTIASKGVRDGSWAILKSTFIKAYEQDTIEMFRELEDDKTETWETIDFIARKFSKKFGREIPLLTNFVQDHLNSYSRTRKSISIMDRLNKHLSPKFNKFRLNDLTMRHTGNEVWIGDGPIIVAAERMKSELEERYLI